MPTLTDARFDALRVLVPAAPPTTNDMLFAWALTQGGSGLTLNGRIYSMLIAQGANPGHVNDMWRSVLTVGGFTGTLNDQMKAFWEAGGLFSGGDPDISSVQFLAGYEGVDAATSYIEESSNAAVHTFAGSAQLDTAQKKFGVSSMLFNGSTDFVTVPDLAVYTLSTGDFTIEFHVRWAAVPVSADRDALISHYQPDTSQRAWLLSQFNDTGTQKFQFHYSINGSTLTLASADFTPVTDTWYHYAVSRVGTSLYMFVDGVQKGTTHDISTSDLFNSNHVLALGGVDKASPTDFFNGWLDEVRVTVGVGRYTSNFTPPTEEYPRP